MAGSATLTTVVDTTAMNRPAEATAVVSQARRVAASRDPLAVVLLVESISLSTGSQSFKVGPKLSSSPRRRRPRKGDQTECAVIAAGPVRDGVSLSGPARWRVL